MYSDEADLLIRDASSSFRIPGLSNLRSDRTHSRFGILSTDTSHASGGVILSGRACPSLHFLPPLFLRLTATLIMYRSISH